MCTQYRKHSFRNVVTIIMVPVYCELCMEVNMDTNNLLGGKRWFWNRVRVPQWTRYTIDRHSVVRSLYCYRPEACPDLLLDFPLMKLSGHIPRNHILLPKSYVVSFPYIFFLLKKKEESGDNSNFCGTTNTYNNSTTAIQFKNSKHWRLMVHIIIGKALRSPMG